MSFPEYANYDGLGLAELVRKGDVKPTELVEEAIARIEKHNPALNAVIYKFYDRGREAARKVSPGKDGQPNVPFAGVPFLLKDVNGNIEGVPTTEGCRFMTGVPATRDDTLVTRFKAAGLIPLAKTNAPECGILPTTEPALYGPTRNPWNTAHSSGGSSGGSAAAVAAGVVPLAHANDGGGSIRIPASCCGLVGIKPTRGRNPLGPDVGDMMVGFVCEGVVSRTVRDSAAALDCTHGHEVGDPYFAPPVERPFLEEMKTAPGRLRIAFTTKNFAGIPLHPECVAAIEKTAKLCEELGHIVEEAQPEIDPGLFTSSFLTVFLTGAATLIEGFAFLNGRVSDREGFRGPHLGPLPAGQADHRAAAPDRRRDAADDRPPGGPLPSDVRLLAHHDARHAADHDRHDQHSRARSAHGHGAAGRLRSVHAGAERDRPAGDLPAAALERGRPAGRPDVRRPLRRRGDALPPRRPARAGAAVDSSQAEGVGLRER